MKTLFRNLASATLVASVVLSTGCTTAPNDTRSSWNIDSVDDRIVKAFTGYRGPIDGSYVDYQAEQKRDISQTLTRHFLNHNGENPLQAYSPRAVEEHRPHSILPNPVSWFHAESIFFGGILTMTSGAFIPIPVDSLLALGSSQGRSEFVEGVRFWDRKSGHELPPSPETFQVKNH